MGFGAGNYYWNRSALIGQTVDGKKVPAVDVGDDRASGLADDRTGGYVPKSYLPGTGPRVNPCGHTGIVQRSRTQRNAGVLFHKGYDGGVDAIGAVARYGHDTIAVQVFVTASNGLAVAASGPTICAREHLSGGGLIYYPEDGDTILQGGDGDGILATAVGEIPRAVDGVDYPPDLLRIGRWGLEKGSVAVFFGKKAMLRKLILDVFDDYGLALMIELGDDLLLGFELAGGQVSVAGGVIACGTSGLFGQ